MVDFKKLIGLTSHQRDVTVDRATSLQEPLKNGQTMTTTTIQQTEVQTVFELDVLRRSLPFVIKIDIEVDESKPGTRNASVVVHYKNGLIAKIECFRSPSNTEELINVALAGAHQCLSDIANEALFTYAGLDRRVRRKTKFGESIDDPIVVSSELESDKPKIEIAVPVGAPGLRDILLSIPGVACMPGENTTSNSQVKGTSRTRIDSFDDPRVAVMDRGRIKHDRVEKPRLNKETADRATNAMAELLRSVGIDGAEEKTDRKR